MPILSGQSKLDREYLYWHYPHYSNAGSPPCAAIRKDNFKLLEFFEDDHLELYDLEKDPQELNSVYGEPAYAKITDEMRKELLRLKEKYLVPEDKRPLPKIIREIY